VVLEEKTSGALRNSLRQLDADRVLLHYSGYGYDKRGIPNWLAEGLEEFLEESSAQCGVFFHELWSSGPFWKSEFYLGGAQKRLARRLHDLADVTFTSTRKMQRLLANHDETLVLLIPSVVPAKRAHKAASKRLRLAVFGQEHTRARSLRRHAKLVSILVRMGMLESLLVIGKEARREEVDQCIGTAAGEIAIAISNASILEIRDVLSEADAFLSFYPANLVTKSSSIMSSLACGCPVILPSGDGADQFVPQPPYMVCDGSESRVRALLQAREHGFWTEIGEASFDWYEAHASWDVTVVGLGEAFGFAKRESEVLA
jgi:glycosyltransferase involved in cell wall biosynthesis